MRISEKKINRICKKIRVLLEKDKNIKLLSDPNTIEAEIKSVLLADLREEDEIEEEAKRILEQHSMLISSENIDYQALLNKAKNQVAKQKGFVL